MSIDDPGWQGGLTPPKPSVSRRPDRKLLTRIGIGAGVAVLIVVIALVGSGHHGKSSGTTTTAAATGGGTSTTNGSSSTTAAAGSIPVLGVTVSSSGAKVQGPGGTPVTIVQSNNQPFTVSKGVTVQTLHSSVSVNGQNKTTPAAVAGIAQGDVIWAIGEVSSSSFTEVTDGTVLSTFMRNYATSGASDDVYVYFYDPATNKDSTGVRVRIISAPGLVTSIDCTAAAGC